MQFFVLRDGHALYLIANGFNGGMRALERALATRGWDKLPLWGGLRVIALPGHTHGHCGYYSAKHKLLFSGDLFAAPKASNASTTRTPSTNHDETTPAPRG